MFCVAVFMLSFIISHGFENYNYGYTRLLLFQYTHHFVNHFFILKPEQNFHSPGCIQIYASILFVDGLAVGFSICRKQCSKHFHFFRTDNAISLCQAIFCNRKSGTVTIICHSTTFVSSDCSRLVLYSFVPTACYWHPALLISYRLMPPSTRMTCPVI